MHSNIIELRDVWKIYKLGKVEVLALRGLNLKIKRNDFLAILGPSGSGKSTILNSIGCLDIPTKGEIYLDEKNIAKLNESDLAKIRGKKIGFVFQTFNLIPSLTALENVILPMTFQGYNKERRKKRAKELLSIVQLSHRLNHKPNELSGGEKQRVAIARALANNPEVILADEPTGNLDSKTGTEIIDLLDKLHDKENKTIIIVTHNPEHIKNVGRVCYLKDGQIIKEEKGGKLKK
jgi:putative ABC transport system ATP-binding protein